MSANNIKLVMSFHGVGSRVVFNDLETPFVDPMISRQKHLKFNSSIFNMARQDLWSPTHSDLSFFEFHHSDIYESNI